MATGKRRCIFVFEVAAPLSHSHPSGQRPALVRVIEGKCFVFLFRKVRLSETDLAYSTLAKLIMEDFMIWCCIPVLIYCLMCTVRLHPDLYATIAFKYYDVVGSRVFATVNLVANLGGRRYEHACLVALA